MNEYSKALGNRIQLLRKERGYSQEKLAKMLNYESGKSIISKIESGKTEPPASKLQDFADALGTNVAYLMGWGDGIRDLTQDEYELIALYRKANDIGKGMALGCLKASEEDIPFKVG